MSGRREGEANGLAFLLWWEVASAAAWIYAVWRAALDRAALRSLPSPDFERSARDAISIVVPARDEARNIGAWLACAAAQRGVKLEIIVVDDHSNDETASIAAAIAARDPRVRVLRAPKLPRGWTGKCWAAYTGARAASGRWILFSDADMRMGPDAVAAALDAAEASRADALSCTATLECRSFVEWAVMPVVHAIIATAYPARLINDDASPIGLMWGGFMLLRADAYARVGGHAAVRHEIAEDRALAAAFKQFGYRVRLFDGSDRVSVRMYDGFSAMWEGWRKNFYEGARRNPILAALFVAGTIGMLVVPMPALGALSVTAARRHLTPTERNVALFAAAGVVASLLVRRMRDRAVNCDTRSVVAMPLAGAFVAAVMMAAAWRGMSGAGQRWKGRTIG